MTDGYPAVPVAERIGQDSLPEIEYPHEKTILKPPLLWTQDPGFSVRASLCIQSC